ncbi:MAG TPA: cation diffusion facilitator family transporter [Jatrophihabitans sp.]|nr:cation diffusion facilitator family transporter [Jatrophihabitans sp.]
MSSTAAGTGRQGGDSRHGHSHEHDQSDARHLRIALGLLLAFMLGEVVVAVLASSLALLSDAGHMLSDVGALGASLWALRLAARPARGAWTYGWKRAEILSAAGNGITLLVVSGIVAIEAIQRLIHPPAVDGLPVLLVALIGVAVNIAATVVLSRGNRESLNIKGAFAHLLTDLYGFLGTVIAGIVILTTGFSRADAIASLVVVALMLHAAWGLVRDSGRILLEAAPADIDLSDVRRHLMEVDHVQDVHDLHVWTVTSNLPTLSAHVVLDEQCFSDGHAPRLLDELQACLGDHFDLAHSTFQFEQAVHAAHEAELHP